MCLFCSLILERQVARTVYVVKPSIHFYCHTLENRSSLPLSPPPVLVDTVEGLSAGFETEGAALLQPPKSSSALTFGGFIDVLKLPWPSLGPERPVSQLKSFAVVAAG